MTTLVYHMRDNGICYGLQTMSEAAGRLTPPFWNCCETGYIPPRAQEPQWTKRTTTSSGKQ
jgi:hypothetical protein